MDIVERLRHAYDYYEPHDFLKTEAADKIERLREALADIDEAIAAWLPGESIIKRTIIQRIRDALKEGE